LFYPAVRMFFVEVLITCLISTGPKQTHLYTARVPANKKATAGQAVAFWGVGLLGQ